MDKPAAFPANKRILYCVLNWGLGHASRSIEVIDQLLISGNEVVLASDGTAGKLLQNKFPTLDYVELPSYGIRYPTTHIFINFLSNAFNLLIATFKEHKQISHLHQSLSFDLLISDNRPGCNIASIPNYYITHQLNPYHPNKILKYFFRKVNHQYINKYQEVWIPDYTDQRLSGSLSDSLDIDKKIEFLGPLSAYLPWIGGIRNKVTILLSGPEPQRTRLENTIFHLIETLPTAQFTFIRGTLDKNTKIKYNLPHIKVIDLCSIEDMNHVLNDTKLLVSRTGYSTIMDIDRTSIPQAFLIPTPGQTEQEYLGQLHKNRFTIVEEKDVKNKFITFFNTFV